MKKLVKNWKSRNFQKRLKSSTQLQMTFWIAEKVAIDCLNSDPKNEKIHNANVWEDEFIFRVMGVFFTIFEKVKKHIFARNFFKMGPMELKICAKKTCNRSGSSLKILSKSDHFSKIYYIFKQGHFLLYPTVWDYNCHTLWS